MNELGTALVWSALQVTLLAVVAAALYPWAARRDPRAGSATATACLSVSVVLTVAALGPLPRWWSWRGATALPGEEQATATPFAEPLPSAETAVAVRAATNTAATGGVGDGGTTSWLHDLWQRWETLTTQTREPARWPTVVALGFLLGTACGWLRFLLGLKAVRDWRRRSRPIDDPSVLRLLETLRADMGCRRSVELRECTNLAGPATVGWRRPLVLLPADWRTWSDAELHAVLAHELAHIRGADYLTWLVARVSVALHFYHPLVYWLAARLHLQQELAADALGARFAGGRGPYLRALAQLALRQDERPATWPARAFLPARGTLLRRIQMLRGTEQKADRSLHWLRRGLTLGLLGGVALGVSALRGPSALVRAEPPQAARVVQDKLPAFDVSFVNEKSLGVVAFRPAVLFSSPELKPIVEQHNEAIQAALGAMGFMTKLDLRLQDIEQLVGDWVHRYDEKAPEGARNAIMAKLFMIRTVRPYDWKAKLGALFDKVEEVKHQGRVFYQAPFPTPTSESRFAYYVPDERTVVIDAAEDLRRLIERNANAAPKHAWAETWRHVEHGWFAMAIHNGDERFVREVERTEGQKDAAEMAFLIPFVKNARSLAFGVAGTDGVSCRVAAVCDSEDKAKTVAQAGEAALTLGRATLAGMSLTKLTPEQTALVQFGKDLAREARVERQGTLVKLHAEAKGNLPKLLGDIVKAEMKAEPSERK